MGPLPFLIYINGLSLVLNKISTCILYADDTSVIISEFDPLVFQDRLTEVFKILNIGYNDNLLSLNFSKTDYIKFTTEILMNKTIILILHMATRIFLRHAIQRF